MFKVICSGTSSAGKLRQKGEARNEVYQDTELTKQTWRQWQGTNFPVALIDGLRRSCSCHFRKISLEFEAGKTVNRDRQTGEAQESESSVNPWGDCRGKGKKEEQRGKNAEKKYKRGRLFVKCSSHSACLHSVLSPYTSSLNLNQLSTSSLCVYCRGSVPAADETCGYGSEAGASYRCGDPSLWCQRLERVGVHSWSSLDLGRGGPTDFKPGDTIMSDNWCQLLESDEGYGTTGCVLSATRVSGVSVSAPGAFMGL